MLKRLFASANRRFIVDEDGHPFFWLGDTAWELFHRLSREDTAHYLENRRQKGMNVIKAVILAEFNGLRVPNVYGHLPLHDEDPTKPNEAYFQHVDAIIDLAAEKALYIGLLPTWGDKVVRGMWGDGPAVFTVDNAYTYGKFLGERYRSHKNILWILGGDRPAVHSDVDYTPIWDAMARGIQSAYPLKAFMTYHTWGGRSSSQYLEHADWLDMHMWQSGHVTVDAANWDMIAQDYQRTPPKPVIDGEPCYEDHPIDPFLRQWKPEYGYFRDYEVRKQAYRAVFAGAAGHTYGHHSIWQFYTPERTPINFPYCTWQEALDRPGAAHMIPLKHLMLSRPYLTRIPDQSLIVSEVGTGGTHVRATRNSAGSGSYAMVYLPTAQTVEIDLSTLTGDRFNAWWFDPRTGESTVIVMAQPRTAPTQTFTPPTDPSGVNLDSVLVLDDAAQQFRAPGSIG